MRGTGCSTNPRSPSGPTRTRPCPPRRGAAPTRARRHPASPRSRSYGESLYMQHIPVTNDRPPSCVHRPWGRNAEGGEGAELQVPPGPRPAGSQRRTLGRLPQLTPSFQFISGTLPEKARSDTAGATKVNSRPTPGRLPTHARPAPPADPPDGPCARQPRELGSAGGLFSATLPILCGTK